jgi:hypothetical protein
MKVPVNQYDMDKARTVAHSRNFLVVEKNQSLIILYCLNNISIEYTFRSLEGFQAFKRRCSLIYNRKSALITCGQRNIKLEAAAEPLPLLRNSSNFRLSQNNIELGALKWVMFCSFE